MQTSTLRSKTRSSGRSLGLALLLTVCCASGALAKYTKVIVVNPTGDPLSNGIALLDALASIPGSAGPDEPWKLKLEPGTYDLGTNVLLPRNFVDIEGCGRDITFIESAGTITVAIIAGTTTELRDLTIRNNEASNGFALVTYSDDLLLTRLFLEAKSSGVSTGLLIIGSSPRVDDLAVSSSSKGSRALGIAVAGGSPTFSRTSTRVSGGDFLNIGWSLSGSVADKPVLEQPIALVSDGETSIGIHISSRVQAQIRNARITVNGDKESRGIELFNAVLNLKGSIVEVSADTSVALENQGSKAMIEDSRLVAKHFGARNSAGATTTFLGSTVSGDVGAQNSSSGDSFRFGNSQLEGSAPLIRGAILTCVFTHKGNFTPRSVLCQ
jgi:hypothetical protein